VLARVDAVTVLSYRDTAPAIMAVGSPLLRLGDLTGRPVRLAAETQPLPDCPECTLAEEGAAALEAVVGQVDAAAATAHPAYAGLVVHHYASWRTMPA
jgi:hypothetical protein